MVLLRLGVWASLNAVSFYEKQGYTSVTDRIHEYHSENLTLVEMKKCSFR